MSSPRSIPTVDRISALPDNIICHTLSFLPTKQSAATSILSKRWYPLWHSVLTLDFDDQNFTDFATFSRFVYSVMLSRNITLPLQSFRLKCGSSSGFNPHDVNIFIEAAVQRGVENLDIDMSHRGYSFKLPLCVFSCSNLTVLKLKAIKMHELFHVNFPLLKTLHLEAIDIKDSNGRSLWILLYGCPILEELQTNGFLFRRKLKAGRDFNGLHKLVRANIMNLGCSVPFDLVRNAKFLRAKLNYPNYDYQVPTFPNLTHMEIAFDTYEWPGKWKLLTEVLQNCPKLQSLTIHEDYKYRQEIGIGNNNWVDLPIVSECLSSQLRTCSIIGYKGMKCELQFVEYILKNAKVLHTMKINASLVDINMKYQMLMKLSLCPRGSTTCVLSFD